MKVGPEAHKTSKRALLKTNKSKERCTKLNNNYETMLIKCERGKS